MLAAAFLLITSAIASTPLGQGELEWGMSEQALSDKYQVIKIDPQNPQGQHYTEFQEINPVVYIDRSTPGQKKEFYFYKGKLYKTLVIHLNQNDAQTLYLKKIKTLTDSLGEPDQKKQSMVFNLPVLHTIWNLENEQYDLRFGAGYIYEVRTHIPVAVEKEERQDSGVWS